MDPVVDQAPQNPQQPVTPPVSTSHSWKRLVVLFVVILVLCGVGLGAILLMRQQEKSSKASISPALTEDPTPTPLPFSEMTIPSLRNQEFKSELGPLEPVSTNGTYTSYRTSYASEGNKIYAQLTIPQEDRPLEGFSAIIFIHGYIPPDSYQTFSNYSSYVDYLARSGFVVMKIDLRGHGESEGEPGGAYYSADYIIDALNARAALQSTDFVNPTKIGLWGHSMAGNVVLRSLAVKPEIKAASIWGGAVYTYEDWKKYGIQDGSYRPPTNANNVQSRRQRLMNTYGEFDATSPFWSQFAATNYLKDIKGAIQLNHTVNDDVVNIGYSRDLKPLLDTNNIKNELNEYPTGGHNFVGASFTQAMQRTVEFFRQNL